MEMAENLVKEIFAEIKGIEFTEPFQVLNYQEAMCRYGSDKPDLRFGMEIEDITNIVSDSSFQVFKDTVINNGCVRGINIKGFGNATRKEIDELTDLAKTMKAKGLAWVAVHEDEIKSPIQKFMTEQEMSEIIKALKGQPGDLLIFVAGHEEMVAPCLGNIRLFLGKKLGLIDPKAFRFLWVVDFPMFEYDEEEKRYTAVHHPFTAPLDEDIELLLVNPSKMRAKAYDMVLNGTEIGGGSIRIHSREIQEKIFSFLGHSEADARDKFGYLLDAFEYGTPPHGGIAFGFDRLIMIMAGRESIRDVIAFPKTQSATCLMSQAPTEVSDNQLKELSVKVMMPKPL
jgi:aspartyl-tRNA synthetase